MCHGAGEDTIATHDKTTSDYATVHPTLEPLHGGNRSPEVIVDGIDYEDP